MLHPDYARGLVAAGRYDKHAKVTRARRSLRRRPGLTPIFHRFEQKSSEAFYLTCYG